MHAHTHTHSHLTPHTTPNTIHTPSHTHAARTHPPTHGPLSHIHAHARTHTRTHAHPPTHSHPPTVHKRARATSPAAVPYITTEIQLNHRPRSKHELGRPDNVRTVPTRCCIFQWHNNLGTSRNLTWTRLWLSEQIWHNTVRLQSGTIHFGHWWNFTSYQTSLSPYHHQLCLVSCQNINLSVNTKLIIVEKFRLGQFLQFMLLFSGMVEVELFLFLAFFSPPPLPPTPPSNHYA